MNNIYLCAVPFVVDLYDDDGFVLENEFLIVELGSTWEKTEFNGMSDVRLDNVKTNHWIEISNIVFDQCFKKVKAEGGTYEQS